MDELSIINQSLLTLIKERTNFNDLSFNLWFGDLKLLSISEDTASFTTPTPLRRSILLNKHKSLIEQCLFDILGFDVEIDIQSIEKNDEIFKTRIKEEEPLVEDEDIEERKKNIDDYLRAPSESNKIREYTFDNFIEGESNRFAKNACYAVAECPSQDGYNPLFIWGQSGIGKTHLLYAIINHLKRKHPFLKIVYKKSEDFINELITAIKEGDTLSFKNSYRKADVLLIDDIQFISGKEAMQEEFFHTFSALYEADKQIIITSDRPPKDIKTLDDRLRTRFESSLMADILPPSFELRTAIIKKKSEQIGLIISNELIDYIAERLHNDIRQIEGLLKKISAFNSITGDVITKDMIEKAISHIDPGNITTDAMVEKILGAVSAKYSVAVNDIKSKKKMDYIVKPRQIAIYIIKELTNLPYEKIGSIFSMHHSSAIAAYNKADLSIKSMVETRSVVQKIIKEVKS